MIDKLKKNELGFWEVSQKPSQQELTDYYAKKYYQDALGSYQHTYSTDELALFNAKLEQKYLIIKEKIKTSNKQQATRLLDVGCGEGFALAYFRKQGWIVKGIDFSSSGIDSQNPECRDTLQTGDIFILLDEEISAGNKYHVVWLQNVLEHVLEPIKLLQSLKSLLEIDGIAVITVPNDFSIIQQKALELGYIDKEFWVALPDHLSYFNHISLPATTTAAGWKCLEMLADFPIDWFLFNQNSNYIKNKELGKLSHQARVQIENLIHVQGAEISNEFYSAMAKLGIGRNLTIFLQAD
ncbi:class I SAM-dependent methyltransferase [Thiolinea disciformis]|uniref:class I SAM-dependent methyltransferase n=1 Tax=Thiolinea disciformis TaxID=125614 RepID=UPI000369B136|nr:methyltransferase domain-containing protein [Thiolinea disciformis]